MGSHQMEKSKDEPLLPHVVPRKKKTKDSQEPVFHLSWILAMNASSDENLTGYSQCKSDLRGNL